MTNERDLIPLVLLEGENSRAQQRALVAAIQTQGWSGNRSIAEIPDDRFGFPQELTSVSEGGGHIFPTREKISN